MNVGLIKNLFGTIKGWFLNAKLQTSKQMPKLDNTEKGFFTHKVTIDMDTYNEWESQSVVVPLIGSSDEWIIKDVAVYSDSADMDGGASLTVEVGSFAGDVDLFITSVEVGGQNKRLVAHNTGAAFNDGTTDNTVNSWSGDFSVFGAIATITTDAADLTTNNGGKFHIFFNAVEPADIL